MKILALDPSTTRTGYAVMRGCRDIVDAGYLTPRRVRDDAETRIDAMANALAGLLNEHEPQRVVIEVPSKNPGAGGKRGATGRLAIYGMAVGELRRLAKEMMPALQQGSWSQPLVISVDERRWTARRPKAKRQQLIAALFPAYRAKLAQDTGADVADAIGIGLWWYEFGQLTADAVDSH